MLVAHAAWPNIQRRHDFLDCSIWGGAKTKRQRLFKHESGKENTCVATVLEATRFQNTRVLFSNTLGNAFQTRVLRQVSEATPFQTCLLRQVCRGDALSNTCVATGVLEATVFQSSARQTCERARHFKHESGKENTCGCDRRVRGDALKRVLREACPATLSQKTCSKGRHVVEKTPHAVATTRGRCL